MVLIKTVVSVLAAQVRRFRSYLKGLPRFAVGIMMVVILTFLLTTVSVAIYVSSGVSSIDLSRPGYEQAREELITTDANDNYSSTGPVNPKTIEEFNKLYDGRLKELEGLGTYRSETIDDTNLGLTSGASQEANPSP